MDLKQLIEELTEVKNKYGNMQIVMDENLKQEIIKVKGDRRMTIPKNIVDKMEQVNKLMEEIDKWIDEHLDVDGSKHDYNSYLSGEYKHTNYYEFTDKPTGREQDYGEYCEQWECGDSGDWYQGYYYYPTEKGNYFYFYYDL